MNERWNKANAGIPSLDYNDIISDSPKFNS